MLGVVGNSLMLVVAVSVVELFAKRVAGCVAMREGTVGEGELSFVVTSSFSLCNVFVCETTVVDKVFDASTESTGRPGSPRGRAVCCCSCSSVTRRRRRRRKWKRRMASRVCDGAWPSVKSQKPYGPYDVVENLMISQSSLISPS